MGILIALLVSGLVSDDWYSREAAETVLMPLSRFIDVDGPLGEMVAGDDAEGRWRATRIWNNFPSLDEVSPRARMWREEIFIHTEDRGGWSSVHYYRQWVECRQRSPLHRLAQMVASPRNAVRLLLWANLLTGGLTGWSEDVWRCCQQLRAGHKYQ